jgi:hypothetical protein
MWNAAMNRFLRGLALVILLPVLSAFAGDPYTTVVFQAGSTATTINLPAGKILTVITFTADGSTQAGGTTGLVQVGLNEGLGEAYVTVLRTYDPANLNDMQHTVVIAGQGGSGGHPALPVTITPAENVNTVITYSITSN